LRKLDGNQANTNSPSVGNAIFSYNCDLHLLEYLIIHTLPLANSGTGYINSGAVGSVDSVLFPLPTGVSPIYGSVTLTSDEQGLLFKNLLFVGIYSGGSQDTSSGLIRGQILDNDWQYFAYLSGTNVVPPVTTAAVGIIFLNPRKGSSSSNFTLQYQLVHNVPQASSAAIYYGTQYENGKKLMDLPSSQSPTTFTLDLTQNEHTVITSQATYLVLQSSSDLFGAVRGQIIPLSNCDNGGASVPSYPFSATLKSSEVNFLGSSNNVVIVSLNSSSSLVPSLYLIVILFSLLYLNF